jgi:hypothetical protein
MNKYAKIIERGLLISVERKPIAGEIIKNTAGTAYNKPSLFLNNKYKDKSIIKMKTVLIMQAPRIPVPVMTTYIPDIIDSTGT